jgi:hypothetical protein
VALSPMSPLSHVLPCFPTLKLSSLHQVIFRHPYLTHMKFDCGNLLCYESITILPSTIWISHSKKKFLPLNFKILWSNKFMMALTCRLFFFWKSRWPLFLMKIWTLNLNHTNFPFLHFSILQANPPNFYWISKCLQQSGHPTKFLFFFPLQLL